MPPVRQGLCSDSAREGSTPGVAAESRGCGPPALQKNRSKTTKEDLGKGGAEP